jgi:hypothetical protein
VLREVRRDLNVAIDRGHRILQLLLVGEVAELDGAVVVATAAALPLAELVGAAVDECRPSRSARHEQMELRFAVLH